MATFVDPWILLTRLRENARLLRIGTAELFVEVKIGPWPKYDEAGERVIGRRGRKYELALRFYQNKPRR